MAGCQDQGNMQALDVAARCERSLNRSHWLLNVWWYNFRIPRYTQVQRNQRESFCRRSSLYSSSLLFFITDLDTLLGNLLLAYLYKALGPLSSRLLSYLCLYRLISTDDHSCRRCDRWYFLHRCRLILLRSISSWLIQGSYELTSSVRTEDQEVVKLCRESAKYSHFAFTSWYKWSQWKFCNCSSLSAIYRTSSFVGWMDVNEYISDVFSSMNFLNYVFLIKLPQRNRWGWYIYTFCIY